ncbi:MAG TPA: PLP-dependent aminotransferase family protein [Nocardioides sp.]|uniref:MocR-like pyridoxine biosynthesis transcription factor PdxR n=1 Tax=Nocardioides sp. TaxID=35761 RepID=UPI002E37CB20|nr:PLP-dependent aminotransferase family protein [Nocardioides sp.]HEX3931883.1 PLP-dependent aminotransferase family protein [Nocardioides sp.]
MPHSSPVPVRLDRAAGVPLVRQLATSVREQVVSGSLPIGLRLPSTRALAADLGVSRSVTEQAYDQLTAEGWLESRRGSGTYVAAGAAPPRHRPLSPPRQSRPGLLRLDTGTPWIDPRHRAAWRRAWRDVSTATPPPGYDDPAGLVDLRAELAGHLARTRGLLCDPDEIVVTTGTIGGLGQVLAALPPGSVAHEDPGYRAAAEAIRAAGREIRDLPATRPVTELTDCAAAYVTPAHQHPLGPVMSGADRLGLLRAARAAGSVVVEDDYDSEFRYDVAPVPALAALDREVVAYLGTTSKTVGPSMRLGWLVAPSALHRQILARREVTHDTAAWPVQRAFLSLLRDGYVDQVVRSARRTYAARAERVVAALAGVADPIGPVAGMYACVPMPRPDALRVATAARAAGFDLPLLHDYCRSSELTGIIVGFGGCTDDELDRALAAIVRALV